MTNRPARRWAGCAAFACFLWAAILVPSPLSAQSRDERSVRAAYIFNLIPYINWPPDKHELLIGIVGSRATGEMMQKMLNGKTTESRSLRILLSPSNDELRGCSIVYFADSQKDNIPNLLGTLKNTEFLTVGDSDLFAQQGGMIGLVKDNDHIQIEVNLDATQRSGIRISSHILNLARIVPPDARGRN